MPTPGAAAEALVAAIEARDPGQVQAIVGPTFAERLRSKGQEALEADRERFLAAARRTRVVRRDGEEGVEVVRDRVVGRNELKAIEVLRR